MSENEPEVAEQDQAVRTLHVRIEGSDSFFERIEDSIEHIVSNEEARENDRGLSLPDEEALARVFSAQNLQLVRAIAEHDPSSMRELANIVDRDIKNVSQNLNELESLGLVDLLEEGRAKRPIVPYDAIEVVYPVRRERDSSSSLETSVAD